MRRSVLCVLQRMQLERGVPSESFEESEKWELWTSSVWHRVERSMMTTAEAEFSGLWK